MGVRSAGALLAIATLVACDSNESIFGEGGIPRPGAARAPADAAPIAQRPEPAAAAVPAPLAEKPAASKAAPTKKKKSSRGSKSTRTTTTSSERKVEEEPEEQEEKKKKLANGAKCSWGSDCQSDECKNGFCQNWGSSARGAADGTKCGWDGDCASGNCDFDKCAPKD